MSESSQKSSGVGQHSLESSMQSAATTRQEISREIETEWRSSLAGSAAPALFAVTSPVSDKTNKWTHTGVWRCLSSDFKELHRINPAQQLEGSDVKYQLCFPITLAKVEIKNSLFELCVPSLSCRNASVELFT